MVSLWCHLWRWCRLVAHAVGARRAANATLLRPLERRPRALGRLCALMRTPAMPCRRSAAAQTHVWLAADHARAHTHTHAHTRTHMHAHTLTLNACTVVVVGATHSQRAGQDASKSRAPEWARRTRRHPRETVCAHVPHVCCLRHCTPCYSFPCCLATRCARERDSARERKREGRFVAPLLACLLACAPCSFTPLLLWLSSPAPQLPCSF